jgi:DNA segregation ATPase FtsK/SpoIIIE, S-DNA-T family
MPDRMPIGYDIGLLCDAVEVVTRLQQASATVIQRKLRVGFVKAGRLLLLLSDYGITGAPDSRGRYPVLVAWEDHAATIAQLREMAGKEESDA